MFVNTTRMVRRKKRMGTRTCLVGRATSPSSDLSQNLPSFLRIDNSGAGLSSRGLPGGDTVGERGRTSDQRGEDYGDNNLGINFDVEEGGDGFFLDEFRYPQHK